MKTIPRYLAAAAFGGLSAFTGFLAFAQPPIQSAPVVAGTCQDTTIGSTLLVREVTTTYPTGFSQKFAHLLPLPHPLYGPNPIPIPAAPDPSGLHMLAIKSGIAGNQFWIARDGQLIRIDPAGHVIPIGSCSLHPAFVAQFPPPAPPMPTQFTSLASGFGGAAIAPLLTPNNPTTSRKFPDNTFADAVYTVAPVLVKSAIAQQCTTTAKGNRKAFFQCIASHSLPDKQKAILDCATQNGSSKEKIALCLTAAGLSDKEKAQVKQVETCYAQHGTNWNAYPVCLASANADPTMANAVTCIKQNAEAGKQPDFASFAMCVAGPSLLKTFNPNAESQVAIDCAMQSGGEPEAFVACTGGTLLATELEKCVTKGFGPNGCFGNGNTLTKVYNEIDDGVKDAFGANSAAYIAWQFARANQDPRAMIDALTRISAELDKAGDNIAAETQRGLDKAGNALAEIVPQVTIGKPVVKGRIFGKKFRL